MADVNPTGACHIHCTAVISQPNSIRFGQMVFSLIEDKKAYHINRKKTVDIMRSLNIDLST